MNAEEHPLVSVVISVYGREKFLPLAIQSALNQTWPRVEIIVAEDGGSDCARRIVTGFALPESRLRLVQQPANVGAAANKLHAWRMASGQFLVNLDDDDLLEPEFIARLLPPLIHDPALVLSFCDHFQINEQGEMDLAATNENTKLWKRDILPPGPHRPFLQIGLVDQSIPFAMGSIWNKSRLNLDDFNSESGPSYDLYMTYVAARTGLGAFYVPERLTCYRVHSAMETRTGRERIHRANIFCNRRFLKDPALAPWRKVFESRLADAYAGLALVFLRQKRRVTASALYARSFWVLPSRRALAGLAHSLMPNQQAP